MITQSSLEEMVLTLLCFSTEHAHLITLKLGDSKIFTNPSSKRIAEVAFGYISVYGQPPKQALEYLLELDMRHGEAGRLVRQQLDILVAKINQIDPSFVLQELDNFLQTQKLTTTLQNSLELLQEGKLAEAKELTYKSISEIPTNSNGFGLRMKDPNQALKFLSSDESIDFFSSGIDIFDDMGFRPERKTFFLFLAAAKKGKSWFGVQVGKRGLQHHHKVLHITTEISEEKTARRYIQSIFSLTKQEAETLKTPFFQRNENGNVVIQFRQLERDSVINKKPELMEKLSTWYSCPEWIIKEFPTSTLSTEHLNLYLDSLVRELGFKADLLVIDYADLMKIDSESLRIDTGRLYRELRGISVSRNLALVSMTQGNRESEDAKLVGKTNVAEDWSKVGTVDSLVTLSQTPDEHKLRLARLFAAASRDAADRFIALISTAFPIGQFCLDSVLMNADLVEHIKTLGTN